MVSHELEKDTCGTCHKSYMYRIYHTRLQIKKKKEEIRQQARHRKQSPDGQHRYEERRLTPPDQRRWKSDTVLAGTQGGAPSAPPAREDGAGRPDAAARVRTRRPAVDTRGRTACTSEKPGSSHIPSHRTTESSVRTPRRSKNEWAAVTLGSPGEVLLSGEKSEFRESV